MTKTPAEVNASKFQNSIKQIQRKVLCYNTQLRNEVKFFQALHHPRAVLGLWDTHYPTDKQDQRGDTFPDVP